MIHDTQQTPLSPRDAQPFELAHRQSVGAKECSHLLIPTALNQRELPAIHVGLRIATAMGAKVTLLHVLPIDEYTEQVAEPPNPWNWLDAIDNLHQKLTHTGRTRDCLRRLDQSRTQMKAYLERVAATYADELPQVHGECRLGVVVEEILQFAAEKSVDLVILSSTLSRWSLSVVPTRLHRMLQQMRKRAIVVHLDSATDTESSAVEGVLRNKGSRAF